MSPPDIRFDILYPKDIVAENNNSKSREEFPKSINEPGWIPCGNPGCSRALSFKILITQVNIPSAGNADLDPNWFSFLVTQLITLLEGHQ